MTFSPILERELRVRARQARTHWTRVGIGAVAVFFSLQIFVLWNEVYGGLVRSAVSAFQTLSWLGFLLACAGCLFTADCLSSERREGTLGLLLLARVSAREVVLGKLAAHGLALLFGLATLTPLLMLPVLAGGVTWPEVLWTTASWLAMLWFSLCLGLWASSKGGTMTQALRRAAIWFVVGTVAPLLFWVYLVPVGGPELGEFVRAVSPVGTWVEPVNLAASPPGVVLFTSLVASGAWGLLFLALAGSELKRNDEVGQASHLPSNPQASSPVEIEQSFAATLNEAGQIGSVKTGETPVLPLLPRPRRPLGDTNPLEWLLVQDKAQVWMLWLAVGISVFLPILNIVLAYFVGVGLVVRVFSAAHLVGGIGSAALFAMAGARFFNAARRDGALELLCTTPLGAVSLVQSKWRVLRRRLLGPLLFMVLFVLVFNAYYWLSAFNAPTTVTFGGGVLVRQLLLNPMCQVLDAVALCWLGMSFGLRARNVLSAVLVPVGLVWGLDWIMIYGFSFLLNAYASGITSGPLAGVRFFGMIVLPLLTIVKQVWLVRWARKRLREDFAGLEPVGLTKAWQAGVNWLRQARHWTGGDA